MTNQGAIVALSNRPCASHVREETIMRFKFLALVLVSAVAVSSTSTFAHTHKRTHHRSVSNSMNMMKGPVERQPTWIPSPGFQTDSSSWGGGSGGGGGDAGAGGGGGGGM